MTEGMILSVKDFRNLLRSLDADRSKALTFALINISDNSRELKADDREQFAARMQYVFSGNDVYQIDWSTFVVKWNVIEDINRYDDLKSQYCSSDINPKIVTKQFDVKGSFIDLWNEFECESRKCFSKSESGG